MLAMSPGDHPVGRHLLAAEGMRQGADPLVLVVVGVAGALAEERREVAGDVHRDWSGSRVPEKTRTTLTRPTYGSLVVFTTSATSGPDGSHGAGAGRRAGSGVNTSGGVCSGGDGKPRTIRSSSSVQPTPVAEHTGITGKNVARATAFSRSATSTSSLISSPPR